MKKFVKKLVQNCGEKIYETFESSSGNMILITTAVGVFLSTVAQSLAVIGNKNYSVSQKAFMIPQELTEGVISIGTLLVTSFVMKASAAKLVESGKIITKDLKSYLKNNNALQNIGNSKYSVSKTIDLIKEDVKNSNTYKKGNEEIKKALLEPHNKAIMAHEQTKDATSAIVTTAGSIISTAVFVPLIRNSVAAKFQPANIEIMDCVQKQQSKYHANSCILAYNSRRNYGGMRV